MNLRSKLLASYFSIVFLAVSVGLVFVVEVKKLERTAFKSVSGSLSELSRVSYLDSLAQSMRYDDEVLTQSARNYAFTGDAKWKDRYSLAAKDLDAKLDAAKEKGDAPEKNLFEEIDTAKAVLVDTESHSMALVDQGNRSGAVDVLESQNYRDYKKVYSDSLNKYLDSRSMQSGSAFLASADIAKNTSAVLDELIFRILEIFAAGIVASALVCAAIAWRFACAFTRPILTLKLAMQRIASGKSEERLEIASKDEFGELSRTFNVMADELGKSRFAIEKEISRKTADLKKFELALDNISEQVVITDREGIMVYGNKMVEKITGYTLGEAVGKKAGTLWSSPMPQEYYKKLWDTIRNKKETFAGEIRNKRKSGQIYIAVVNISPVLDDAGNILFFVGIERDVTEERKVLEDNSRLATIVRDTKETIFSKDLKGIILSWNGGAENMYGYSEKEAVGKNIKELIVPEEKYQEVDDILDKILHGVRLEKYESKRRKKDGTVLEVEMTISPLYNSQGVVVGASVVARDVTKEREIDRAKTEFVSLASHQLRTPLSVINWYTEMLLSGDAGTITDTQKEYLEEVHHGSKRMSELVGALLNVSRIELGTFAVLPEPTDVVALAREVIDELKPKILEKRLHIEMKFAENFPEVTVDPKLTRIIFQNLLTNAVKYTPEEGTVSVSVDRASGENMFSIAVSDTGYGIPRSEQSSIFTKMFRATNVREKETDGTGLGLYIVKSIVEHSGGTIRFASEEGKGTTFTITLPVSGMARKEGARQIEWKEEM